MADIKWIKITTDIFDDEKIKLIDALPESDGIIVIWFKLLTLAGKINDNGNVYISKKMPITDEMLSTIFNRPLNTVRLALNTFKEFGMIEIEDHINIINWEKHQNISGMEKVKLQNAERQRKYREKNKQEELPEPKKEDNNNDDNDSNVIVTLGNATDKIREDKNRIELDKNRIDLESNKEKDIISDKSDNTSFKTIIDYLNLKASTNYKCTTKKSRSHINARLEEGFTIEDFKIVIDKKCKEWLNDPDMCGYIRPETLFGTKFESYLNQKEKAGRKNGINQESASQYGDIGIVL